MIRCDRHGDRRRAFVCVHLLLGNQQGFCFDPDDPSPHPDAWCSQCERARIEHGDVWNEEIEALMDIRLVCGDCYDEIKFKNARPDQISEHIV